MGLPISLLLLLPLAAAPLRADVFQPEAGECQIGAWDGQACKLDDGSTGACAPAECGRRRGGGAFRKNEAVFRPQGTSGEGARQCLRCLPGTPRERNSDDGRLPPIVYIAGGLALLGVLAGVALTLNKKKPPAAEPPAA